MQPDNQQNTPQNQNPSDTPELSSTQPHSQINFVSQAADIERNGAAPVALDNQGDSANAPRVVAAGLTEDLTTNVELGKAQEHMNGPIPESLPIGAARDVSEDGLPGLPPVASGKKSAGKNLILIVLAIAILGAAGYFIYTAVINSGPAEDKASGDGGANLVSDTGLVETKVEGISYSRPRSWEVINEGSSYGHGAKGTDLWSSMVVVTQDAADTSLVNASDETYASLRTNPYSSVVDGGTVTRFLERTGEKCSSDPVIRHIIDEKTQGNLVGLFVSEATCATAEGSVTIKEKTTIGKDGIKRYLIVLATDDEWSKNEALFSQMLDSMKLAS